ncbi:MAG: hypothetical protein AB1598_00310 [Thermodesulfobacteriota bacterium]
MSVRNFVLVLFSLSLLTATSAPLYSDAEVLCSNNKSGIVKLRPEECEPNESVVDLSGIAQAPGVKPPRWRWIGEGEGTYWYVPNANLPAVVWNASDPMNYSPIPVQTVWHIEHYEDGYFFGTVVPQFGAFPPQCQYMIGSVTPNGSVYISFNSLTDPPAGSPSLTTGVGEMVLKGDEWTVNMQMSSGSSSIHITHWAYMLECTPDEECWTDLPGVHESLPDFLANCAQE